MLGPTCISWANLTPFSLHQALICCGQQLLDAAPLASLGGAALHLVVRRATPEPHADAGAEGRGAAELAELAQGPVAACAAAPAGMTGMQLRAFVAAAVARLDELGGPATEGIFRLSPPGAEVD